MFVYRDFVKKINYSTLQLSVTRVIHILNRQTSISSDPKRIQCDSMHISHSADLGSEDGGSKFLVHVSCTAHFYTVSTLKRNETSDFITFGHIQLTFTLCCLPVGSFQVLTLIQ